jgi:heptosyltransferase-2/heptosyltransferase-3
MEQYPFDFWEKNHLKFSQSFPKPESLRLKPNGPYAFKSWFKTIFFRMLDAIGSRLFAPSRPTIDWGSVQKIAVIRLDQLGDALLALPCLEALSQAIPQARIDFYVGPGSKDIVEISRLKIGIEIFAAPWFSKETTQSWSWKSIWELKRRLQKNDYDVVIDLRGDFRHILAMKLAGIPVRIGQTRTGGGFLLTHPVVYHFQSHEVDQNLLLLSQVGVKTNWGSEIPRLFPNPEDETEANRVIHSLKLTKPIVALHATCTVAARQWPAENWRKLVDNIPDGFDVVIIGSKNEITNMEEIFEKCSRKVILAAGLFNLRALTAFLKQSKLFIGVNSGPAHIAAAVGIPVLSLFSGTNSADQWKPRGLKVTVLQKITACSPCERAECPLDNECMRQIDVKEILDLVRLRLK